MKPALMEGIGTGDIDIGIEDIDSNIREIGSNTEEGWEAEKQAREWAVVVANQEARVVGTMRNLQRATLPK